MDTMLEIRNLTKQYRDFTLDSVSFSVPGGSIMGFVGENGAGKTTTLKLILDEMPRDGGSVSVFGKDNIREGEAVRQEIGVVFDECCFHEQFAPKNIGSILKSCYRGWDTAYYRSLLQRFSLPLEKPVKAFSRGMKMKLSLAAALAHRPRLLLLDVNCRIAYVWGTYGEVLTRSYDNAKAEQYPDEVGGYADFIESNWLGGRTSDCNGLIKGIWLA